MGRFKDLIQYDSARRRVWVRRQRIHHGPVGLSAGFILVALHRPLAASVFFSWGWSDLHDYRVWFQSGYQGD